MQIDWRVFGIKVASWLVTEVILNCVGLDHLANYGEFVLEHYISQHTSQTVKPWLVKELIYQQEGLWG